MSPILVPTLAELSIELNRHQSEAEATWALLSNAPKGSPEETALNGQWETAAEAREAVFAAIVAQPAASIADLRVKAYALALFDRIYEGEAVESPSSNEAAMLRQLIAGLLDERIV